MNFLAHAYLSFQHADILIGNMISDFVKGKAKFSYPAKVQLGMQLHRDIDYFTDHHPSTATAKEIFKPDYRLYSGALVDILYDYFLANDEREFTKLSLHDFTTQVYAALDERLILLPENFLTLLPSMKKNNWLYHYHTKEGIQRSLQGMVRRATYLTDSERAFYLFKENEELLRNCYEVFFPAVKQMAKERLLQLLA